VPFKTGEKKESLEEGKFKGEVVGMRKKRHSKRGGSTLFPVEFFLRDSGGEKRVLRQGKYLQVSELRKRIFRNVSVKMDLV